MKFSTAGNTCCILILSIFWCTTVKAHNGEIAHAYPLGKITVNGDLSDWPISSRYSIKTVLSGKSLSKEDFSGYFQVGYRADNRSLYLAITITDNDFIEDTSATVAFNTQDCLELGLDARHLPFGSGVAGFMYSKKLRNINNAVFDPFAKAANWNMMEVAMTRKGNQRFYEWRIQLNEEFVIGKSIGLDFTVFDKDSNGNFNTYGWGRGGSKFKDANSLGDIVLMSANSQLAKVIGRVNWDRKMNVPLPGVITMQSTTDPRCWVSASIDSTGKYTAMVPVGKYNVNFIRPYFYGGEVLYASKLNEPLTAQAAVNTLNTVKTITITGMPVPDLLPSKGILHDDLTPASTQKVDDFVKTYMDYYGIPGVSLALIKDGKLVYYNTYGYKNSITKEKVDSNTLFEAASITKPVFAFAVQRLAERGVIDLNRPLYEYLPYPDIAYDDRYKLITAKHVLTHRTGFPNWRSMNKDNKLNLLFTPGTDFNYSGEGFEYLKLVVQQITGKQVEQVLKEEVLDPVGLYHTFFSANDSLKQFKCNGHYDRIPNYKQLPESPGMAYSMHTEAKVFTRFMLYMLEQKGLSAATYDSMFTKHSDYKFDPGEKLPRYPSYMGMSLEIRETPYGKSFGHGGNNGDFRCQFEVFKDLKMGYVLFTNANTAYPFLDKMRQFLVEGKE